MVYTSAFYFQKAMKWFVVNRMDEAIDNMEEEDKEHKDNGYAYSMMGYMQCFQRDYKNAEGREEMDFRDLI